MSLLRLLLDYIEKMPASKMPDHPIRTMVCALAGFNDKLSDIAEWAWKCNLDHVKWMFKTEEDNPYFDDLVARGIWEFTCSSELLGQCAKTKGVTEPVHSCQETRVWGSETLRESYNSPSYLKDRLLQYPQPALLGIYPKFYVQKARLRVLMDVNELKNAEEPAKKVLETTDSAPDADGIRSILLRWSF
ncbi:hypothetical protein DL770_008655 [Monosporascus sp. CRB-9-2]|nr:hypothetical protein DL770_008655 [Monosporascus sp. CRB-9-2]